VSFSFRARGKPSARRNGSVTNSAPSSMFWHNLPVQSCTVNIPRDASVGAAASWDARTIDHGYRRNCLGGNKARPALTKVYAANAQPAGLNTLSVEAGFFSNAAIGRIGRRTSSPRQLGHVPPRTPSAHAAQNVHSNEQIRASLAFGGRSALQHSQFGLI
jgi:hypothetical protein